MNNIRQVKENEENSFGKRAAHGSSYGHWQGHQSNHHAANRISSLREETAFHASVSQGPPPSFLVQTPLGTPHEETFEFKPRAEIPVRRQQEGPASTLPQHGKTFEQVNQAPRMLKQQKRQERLDRGADKNGMVHRWVYEEVRLSMSKMSILSTVLGLLFLGILFFIIGFLVAVSTLKTEETHDSQSAWKASNAPEQEGGKKSGMGAIAGRVGGSFVGGAASKEFAPLGKAFGHATAIVPGPLQPFARYGIGSTRREVHSVGRAVNPFARRGAPQEQQQYDGTQQQQQGMPQQYAAPQGQPYASPAVYPATGYRQPATMPQGGYAQGYPPAQQAMMQQPMQQQPMHQQYYQQPYNQQPVQQQYMAPQQMMPPQQAQMVPQQMMQQPQYQQQMAPQPGYYR